MNKHFLLSLAACSLGTGLATGLASAGGIDRSGQSLNILYEKGNYLEFSFGRVIPDVSGHDLPPFGSGSSGDVAGDHSLYSAALKMQLSDRLGFALILDQPYGASILYGTGSVALGGTSVDLTSRAVTGVLRYNLSDRFSVHGGVRYEQANAAIGLAGAAYGALNGYGVELDRDGGFGYVVGAAYEIPDIALRVALTYNSQIEHKFDTHETGVPVFGTVDSTTKVKAPPSINLDFQTGVAPDWLVFGGVRWVPWSRLTLRPQGFDTVTGGLSLIDLNDTATITLGVGHKFNETWSGALSFQYEREQEERVSPLAPTIGRKGVSLAAVYTKGNLKVTTGINYTKLGNATPRTGGVPRADFEDNSSWGFGVKVGYFF